MLALWGQNVDKSFQPYNITKAKHIQYKVFHILAFKFSQVSDIKCSIHIVVQWHQATTLSKPQKHEGKSQYITKPKVYNAAKLSSSLG